MTDNARIPVTVLRGLPEGKDAALITEAVSAALSAVVSETSASSRRYSDPREVLRRHPRGTWGVPGQRSPWQMVFSPAGFRG